MLCNYKGSSTNNAKRHLKSAHGIDRSLPIGNNMYIGTPEDVGILPTASNRPNSIKFIQNSEETEQSIQNECNESSSSDEDSKCFQLLLQPELIME